MKRSILILLQIIIVAVTTVASAEQPPDITLGKVLMRNMTQLGNKQRSDVTALAAKIRKKRTAGVIKVRGDYPAAESAEEYLANSVLMAREVEAYLKTLLPANYQIFVTASRYSGEKSRGENSVEILLYPPQVQLQEIESLRFVSTQVSTSSVATEMVRPGESGGSDLLSAPLEDADYGAGRSKRELEKRGAEDAALANELVNKAKARAAEKAKRRASED